MEPDPTIVDPRRRHAARLQRIPDGVRAAVLRAVASRWRLANLAYPIF